MCRMPAVLLVIALGVMAFAAPPPEVEALIKQLTDKDEAVRLKAAKELGKQKEKAKDAIPALKKATEDADEDVQAVAKKALAAVQGAAEKAEPLKLNDEVAAAVKGLQAKDNKTRLAAIAKLEAMGEKAIPAGAALVEFGMMNANQTVRDAATAAFEKIDPPVYKEVVTVLVDADKRKRDRAVDTLQEMGDGAKAAVPALKFYHQLLYTELKQTPGHTAAALVAIAPDDAAVQKMILEVVGGPDDLLPGYSFLEKRVGANFAPRTPVLALLAKLEIEDKRKVAALISGLAACDVPADEMALVTTLGGLEIEKKDKCAALLKALPKAATQRARIVDEIAKLGAEAKDAIPIMKALKTDKEEAVRTAATAALEVIGK